MHLYCCYIYVLKSFKLKLFSLFQAQHSEEREKWVRRLEDTIRRHANRSRLWDNQNPSFYLDGYSNKDSLTSGAKRANYLQILSRRVSEADAYLQLMIEQTNVSITNN